MNRTLRFDHHFLPLALTILFLFNLPASFAQSPAPATTASLMECYGDYFQEIDEAVEDFEAADRQHRACIRKISDACYAKCDHLLVPHYAEFTRCIADCLAEDFPRWKVEARICDRRFEDQRTRFEERIAEAYRELQRCLGRLPGL